MTIKDIFIVGALWNGHECVCVPLSPPPQQVEEDEDNVQVDGESSTDIFLWIQAIAHQPHQHLAVDHQELRSRRRRCGQDEK